MIKLSKSRLLPLIAISAAALSLAACTKCDKLSGTCINQQPVHQPVLAQSLAHQLRRDGITVIQQGERMQAVLPNDLIFIGNSGTVRTSQVSSLNNLATLVKSYGPKATIQVIGYTATVPAFSNRKKISRQHAEVIAAYFWNNGISHRRIVVRGAGSNVPIAGNNTPRGSAYNRRVVVLVNYPL